MCDGSLLIILEMKIFIKEKQIGVQRQHLPILPMFSEFYMTLYKK